jgi:hypothetical protein
VLATPRPAAFLRTVLLPACLPLHGTPHPAVRALPPLLRTVPRPACDVRDGMAPLQLRWPGSWPEEARREGQQKGVGRSREEDAGGGRFGE